MDTKKTIRKLIFTIAGLVTGTALLILLISAIGERKKGNCSDYKITVKSVNDNRFIDNKDVFKLISEATGGTIKGQPVSTINTRKLEAMLKNSVWIKEAQLYFDNKNVLHVSVTEREPLARIFTTAGNSFYIDSSVKKIPLSGRSSARVPVFSGFPAKKILNTNDSGLLKDVKAVAMFISSDPFWSAQVSSIDITPEKNFEIIPVVGNHLLRIGDAENLEQKFHRLFLFYNRVVSMAGFDKYRIIDAQYDGQIVAIRKGEKINAVDTARLKLNVQKLIKQSLEAQNDTMVTARNIAGRNSALNSSERGVMQKQDESNTNDSDPNPLKLSKKPNPGIMKTPKAVMGKRDE